jgi:hypothetical protein
MGLCWGWERVGSGDGAGRNGCCSLVDCVLFNHFVCMCYSPLILECRGSTSDPGYMSIESVTQQDIHSPRV